VVRNPLRSNENVLSPVSTFSIEYSPLPSVTAESAPGPPGKRRAPEGIAKAVDAIQSHSTSNPCSFAQKGALAALKGDQTPVEDMRAEFDLRRNYMVQRLATIDRVSVVAPQGAFYVLANISRLGLSSPNFADRMLSKHHVAVVPGIAFGNDGTVRLSYATSLDIIKKGLDRFEEFCRTL